jgi:CelD/BcsL family acetyltransferase involved in cellulose biosynthesis
LLHVIPTNEPTQSTKSTRLPSRPAGVRVVTSFEETDLDEHGWNTLASSATNSVFQTHQWHRSWWSTYRTSYEPLLVVVSDAGSTCGVAPLMVEQTSARGRVVRFIGEGRADYCDLLAADNWNTVAAMVRGLKDYGAWDILDLSNIPSESHTVAMLKAICEHEGLRVMVHDHFVCPTLMVRGHERAALTVLNKPSLRRRQNYFERIGRLTFRDLTAAKDVEPYLDAFFTQHIARWRATSTPSLFQDQVNRSFYRELTARLDRTGWLLFSVVELDGRPIALHYGFDYNDALIWYKPSFDPAFASGSPGLVLVRHLIHYVLDHKRRELDFTIGDEPFKQRFTNVMRKTVNVQIYRDPARYAFERSRRGLMAAVRRVRNRR